MGRLPQVLRVKSLGSKGSRPQRLILVSALSRIGLDILNYTFLGRRAARPQPNYKQLNCFGKTIAL